MKLQVLNSIEAFCLVCLQLPSVMCELLQCTKIQQKYTPVCFHGNACRHKSGEKNSFRILINHSQQESFTVINK